MVCLIFNSHPRHLLTVSWKFSFYERTKTTIQEKEKKCTPSFLPLLLVVCGNRRRRIFYNQLAR